MRVMVKTYDSDVEVEFFQIKDVYTVCKALYIEQEGGQLVKFNLDEVSNLWVGGK